MKRSLFILLGILLASPVLAVDKTFSWTAPTQNEDGSTLPTAQIEGYRLTCNGGIVETINGPVTSYVRDFGPGDYTCSLQTLANGLASAPSNSVNFNVPQSPPRAPTDFSVD